MHVLIRSPEYWKTIKANNPPRAVSKGVTIRQGGKAAGKLEASDDYDNDGQLAFWVASPPSHGSVHLNGSAYVYTPGRAFWGEDSFTFTVRAEAGAPCCLLVLSADESVVRRFASPA